MNPLPVLKIVVVGHTNTGKTSLMRTLTRNSRFGDVADRPATTGHVEGASLLVDNVPLIVLYDTPGLEDSIGLLEHLESQQQDLHTGWRGLIEQFLDSPDAKAPDGRFAQEAKVIRQVLASDLVLYVADARDRMLGKHHDELEILGRFAKPVLPVLNFTASPEAKVSAWRASLAQARLHMVAEFDTVVFNTNGEHQLFEKLQALLDPFHDTLAALIADRKRQRTDLVSASAKSLADMLIDVAAHKVVVPAEGDKMAAIQTFKQTVRQREQQCVNELLKWHQFQADDYAGETLPIVEGHWGLDLFNPASLQQFGIRAGGGATAGAAGGLAIDAMLGGGVPGRGRRGGRGHRRALDHRADPRPPNRGSGARFHRTARQRRHAAVAGGPANRPGAGSAGPRSCQPGSDSDGRPRR